MVPWGARDDRPDYDYHDGLTLRVFRGGSGTATVAVTAPDGTRRNYTAELEETTE